MTEGKRGHGPLFRLSPPRSSPPLIYLPVSDLEVEGFFFRPDECHQNTICADRMALVRTQVSTSSVRSPLCLLLTQSSSPSKHCMAPFIYLVFRATGTQFRSLLMEKSLWLYSGGVCGQTDIHQWARTVPNWHLEWADESVIVIINCYAFVKWVFEACVPVRQLFH